MPKRKTHIFAYGHMQWLFASFLRKMRKGMSALLPAQLPGNPFQAFHLLNLSQVAPSLFDGNSAEAIGLRRELTELVIKHPEFVSLGLAFLSQKPQASPSAWVRDFLLSESLVQLADGRSVNTVGASDKEIAAAVESRYKVTNVTAKMVSHERRRLQGAGAVKVEEHVDALLKLYPPRLRRTLRQQWIDSYYTPQ